MIYFLNPITLLAFNLLGFGAYLQYETGITYDRASRMTVVTLGLTCPWWACAAEWEFPRS